ncbi:tetratricopeptide repeat protein [Hymenobacter coalescens]
MTNKPWKLTLLAAFSLAGSAVFAQNLPAARQAIELERYSEAKRQLLPSQSNAEAAFELGRLYQKQEKADSAAYFFNMASKDVRFPLAMVSSGRALLAQGKKVEADIQFDAAIKATKSKDAKVFAAIGQAYAESGIKDNQKGIDAINQALKLNKKDDPAWLVYLGDMHQKRDNGGGDAMNAYDRALAADAGYTLAYYRKGQLNVRSRNGQEALANFGKVTSMNSNYAPVYRDMAEMYYYAGQYDQASQTMKQYTDMSEKTPNTQATYAAFLYLNKKYAEALTQIDEVLAKDPSNLTMNRLRAYTLFETGQNDQAVAAMDKYMKMAPAEKVITDDYVYQGKILTKAGRSDEGIAIIEKAIKADPAKAVDLQHDLAQAYLLKKDYPGAIRTYTAIMKAGKGTRADNIYLGRAYEMNKQYAKADSLYGIVVTEKPDYLPGYQMRARANANLDPESKQGLAKPHYEKYVDMAKADPAKNKDGLVEAYKYLGYYYYQKGDKQASLPYWQQALALNPGDAQATTAIGEITGKGKAAAKPAPKGTTKK